MADKLEREIEEILAKLDGEQEPGERTPISIMAKSRKKAQPKAAARPARAPRGNPMASVTPTTLLFAGASLTIGGLIVSLAWAPLIWASFAGVVLFLGAFLWAFRREPRSSKPAAAGGHYWRDRYIEYTPANQGVFDRVKRRFRRS